MAEFNIEENVFEDVKLQNLTGILEKEIQTQQEKAQAFFAGKLSELFIKSGIDGNEAVEQARNTLEHDLPPPSNNGDPDEEDTEVVEGTERYKRLLDESKKSRYLLLYAPVKSKATNMRRDEETHMRQCQYKHFCEVMPGMSEELQNYEFQPISSKDQLLGFIETFMNKFKDSGKIFIVFNGHGNKKFQIIVESSLREREYISLNEFNKKVAECRRKEPPPQFVEIIFGQCYAHEYETTPDNVKVICFTTTDKPTTTNVPLPGGDYKHKELQDYAETERRLAFNLDVSTSNAQEEQPMAWSDSVESGLQ